MLHKQNKIQAFFVFLAGFIVVLSLQFTHIVTAQVQEPWAQPVNLSQSGSTSNPAIAIDSNDNVHIIWLDEFNDYGYARWNGESWSDPVARTYIFYPEIPTLLGGANGLVHIFWITDSGALLHSQVSGTELGNPGSLTPPQVLAAGVLNFHVSADSQGRVHLAYVQGPNENAVPTGIYYRQSEPGGTAWTVPASVYISPYYRSIAPDNAHVYVAATEAEENLFVYLTFDNPALKRVFFAASRDSGVNWEEPLEIDAPDSQSVTTTPFDIIVYPDQDKVLLMWKDNLQSSFDCTQLYQYSNDSGLTWTQPETTFNNLVGCPQGNRLFPGPEDSVLLMVDIQDSTYIQAWNWEMWSEPQVQGSINQFTDPVTFSDLRLTDKESVMDGNFRIYVTGSDRVGNQDTWITFREFSDISTWYPPPQAWKTPQKLAESNGVLKEPLVIHDNSGLFHLFWTQSSDPENPMNEWRIFYSQYNGNEWQAPVAILRSPDKFANEVSATLVNDSKLFAVFSGHESGDLYFAWAQPDRANSVFEWSDPQSIPTPANKASFPEIFSASNNSLFVIYTISVNEGRGVYIVESSDEGVSWSEPRQVFDAAAANWTAVGQAHMTQTADGTLHVLLSQRNLAGNVDASSLYYLNSSDNGQTWSTANLVIDQPAIHFNIIAADQRTIHRYWQTDVGTDSRLWHEVSLDGGLTWITSTPLSVLGVPGPSDMVLDSLDRVHLLQRFADDSGRQFLQHWEYRGNSWESMESLSEASIIDDTAISLSAAAGQSGRLVAVSQEQQTDPDTRKPEGILLASSRLLDEEILVVTPSAPAILATDTPQPEATGLQETAQLTPENGQSAFDTPTVPTPTQITFEGTEVVSPPSGSLNFIIIGVGSAVVIMILLIVVTRLRSR